MENRACAPGIGRAIHYRCEFYTGRRICPLLDEESEAGQGCETLCGTAAGGHVTFAGTMRSFIETRDHNLMRRVHRWAPPRWIRLWMVCATRGGDGWLWYAMGLIILIF